MKYYTYNVFGDNVVAFTTLRELGNVAYQVNDIKEDVDSRREEIAKDFNLNRNDFIFTRQHHSTIINEVNILHKGMGAYSFDSGVYADALYTKDYNIPIGIFHADCVPIFFYAPSIHLVGIIHAGVKGSLNEITFKSLLGVVIRENIDPRDIHLHIGPSLKQKHQLISKDEENYLKMHGYDACVDELHLDNVKLNVEQALRIGVLKENITYCDVNTYEDDNCFSAAKEDKANGRMSSIIFLKS